MAHVPLTAPRVALHPDGQYAAIVEPSRITLVDVPSGAPIGELGPEIAQSHDGAPTEVVWVGSEPRLVLVRHEAARCQILLIDVTLDGPRLLADALFKVPMRLMASAGVFVLVTGSQGSYVLSTAQGGFTAYPLSLIGTPTAACAIGGRFLIALSGSIEEWDPATRVVKRRLRLLRPAHITSIGHGRRAIWVVTSAEPGRIDTVALVQRHQPRTWCLPEPIACISGVTDGDLLACVGAATGRVYLVDLVGNVPLRVVPTEAIGKADAVALVPAHGVLIARANRPIVTVGLDGRPLEPMARGSSAAVPVDVLSADAERAPEPAPITPPPRRSAIALMLTDRAPPIEVAVTAIAAASPANDPPATGDEPEIAAVPAPARPPAPSIAERFAVRRQQRRQSTAS
ncbi:MAG TPA: hypothetical protein VFP84_24170 [Kofleriaceae bacterium]|nr:hypothetical protein [Kofleriaceae bacterium]